MIENQAQGRMAYGDNCFELLRIPLSFGSIETGGS